MKVTNKTKNTVLGDKIGLANTFVSRFLGLIPRASLNEGEGLIIKPCNSIHMFFMRFVIDVLFVDKDDKVVYLLKNFQPWRVSKLVSSAYYVIELPSGTIEKTDTKVGDVVGVEK